MGLNLATKQTIVNQLHNLVKTAISINIATLHKVKANDLNYLRSKGHHANIDQQYIYFTVIKNTLLKLALKNSKFAYINQKLLNGHIFIGLGFNKDCPAMVAQLFNEIQQHNNNFILKCIAIDQKVYSTPAELTFITNLPSYKTGLIKLISIIKYISIVKLLLTLKKITIINQIK